MTISDLFSKPWREVPFCFLDTETTGVRPGVDRAVQVALVRFEGGTKTGEFQSLVNPGIAIPAAATEIHSITNEAVRSAPTIGDVFARPEVAALLDGAWPGAFNHSYDRQMVPAEPFGELWLMPWADALPFIRAQDRYVSGKGRHTLAASCERRGFRLVGAHSSLNDAAAAGYLWYDCVEKQFGTDATLGRVLQWQREQEAAQWHDYWTWKARQQKEGKTR